MFPVITKQIQIEFESFHPGDCPEDIPMICGYKGRACRQMGKREGANRANCTYCPIAEYAKGAST